MTSFSVRRLSDLCGEMRAGALSPVDVVQEFLDRIEASDGDAFGHVAREEANAAAAKSEKRLAAGQGRALEGLPIAVKDDTVVAGMPTSFGTAMLQPLTFDRDALFIARLRAAGAVVVGKTTLPEFGAIAVTERGRFGTVAHPFDAGRTAGGSSGGSAVAVAAGLVPAATGTDGGGSLRIPASCCGLFTLKPTRGRLSVAPYGGESPLVVQGFLTTSVLDNALLLDVAAGSDPGDPYVLPVPRQPFADAVRNGAAGAGRRLRIAFTTSPPLDTPVDPACVAAVEAAAQRCADLGHVVEPATPDWYSPTAEADFMRVWSVLIGSFAQWLADSAGGDVSLADPHNRALHQRSGQTPAPAYLAALSSLRAVVRRMVPLWETYDVLLTPTLALPPLPTGVLFEDVSDPIEPMMRAFAFTPFTPIVNVTGQPAASLPMAAADGLPIGVQAIGRAGEESTLLELAAELEHAHGWIDGAAAAGNRRVSSPSHLHPSP